MAHATKKRVDWPPAVRQYVQRSFVPEAAIDGISKQEMEIKLKRVITEAAESDSLNNVDWARLPLPQQMLQDEKNRAILAPQVLSNWPPPHIVSNFQPPPPPPPPPILVRPIETKKRKSSEFAAESEEKSSRPPWRKQENRPSFEDRLSFPQSPDKRPRLDTNGKIASKSQAELEQRKRRFEASQPKKSNPYNGTKSQRDSPIPVLSGPVVGRSQSLEKNYFRLTSAPNPDAVRPLPVLQKALELLKKKWRKESNYTYICDQFKALRQDLTVQHIKTEFTVSVYEIHARIALEKGDLGEYNQCQTQLRALYKQNLGGHPMEFLAYRILYLIHTCNRTDMNDILADLTAVDEQNTAVRHALGVRSALALGNYHRFFRLYLECPNMGAYLMDMFVGRERLAALCSMCKAYKPDVRIRFLTEELGFESDDQSVRFILDQCPDTDPQDLLQQHDNEVKLLTSKVLPFFERAKLAAFGNVDIKGQI
ncbi:MAG: hypothetical protein Q9160_000055 [Pyrenula sp. 1 TL-2023]